MHRIVIVAVVACSSPSKPAAVATTTTTGIAPATSARSGAPAASTVDRCAAYVERETTGMSWYIGPYGVLDWVDLALVARVSREHCATYSDTELACVSKDGETLSCLPDDKIQALRRALDPALERPADLRARANAATTCESYSEAMRAFEACAAVPAKFRKTVTRAWSSTAGVQTPPHACHIGSEVMAKRLAALGC